MNWFRRTLRFSYNKLFYKELGFRNFGRSRAVIAFDDHSPYDYQTFKYNPMALIFPTSNREYFMSYKRLYSRHYESKGLIDLGNDLFFAFFFKIF